MRRLSLDRLRAFAHVVELGSFSAAAERLEVTQPAISLQVRQLEQDVGVCLVERVGRRVTPTAAGEELLGHARRIDASVSEALEAMTRHATGVIGRVRLGTGATACIYFLPRVLRTLRLKFPSLNIVVSTGSTADMLKALEDNTIDIGLVTMPAPGKIFDVRPIVDDEFVAIASRDGRASLPSKVTPAVLAEHPVVLYQSGAHTRQLIDQWAMRAGVSLKPVMELGSVEAIKELVGAGLGWSVVPSLALPTAAAGRKTVTRPLSPRLFRKLALVLRRDKPLQRGLREVIGAVSAAAEERAAAQRGNQDHAQRRETR